MNNNTVAIKRYEIVENIRGCVFRFVSYSTVFSKNKIDKGSKFFAENMVILDNSKVLDLGCGYGIFGIVYGKVCESCDITMVDINPYAIKAAKSNIKINNVNARVLLSNLFEKIPNEVFDVILTYPPYSSGKSIVTKFVKESYKHLNQKGVLQLLTTKFYDYVKDYINKTFGNVYLLDRKGIYRIYVAVKE